MVFDTDHATYNKACNVVEMKMEMVLKTSDFVEFVVMGDFLNKADDVSVC